MKATKADHAIALVKAGMNLLPGYGGAIASLIGDYIPTATQRNLAMAVELLEKRLIELDQRIDVETVNKEEFAELFKTAYLIIIRSHKEERIRAAMRLVANLLLNKDDPEKLSYTELDHFARCLDQLSIGALAVLSQAVMAAEKQAPGFLLHKSVAVNFHQLHGYLPDFSAPLLMGLIGELDSFNLIHRVGVPTVRTSDYGNYSLEVTPLGARFVQHLLADTE